MTRGFLEYRDIFHQRLVVLSSNVDFVFRLALLDEKYAEEVPDGAQEKSEFPCRNYEGLDAGVKDLGSGANQKNPSKN